MGTRQVVQKEPRSTRSLNTFIAVLIGFGLFIAAIILSTDNYMVFVSGASIILVLGGTLAATFISYEYQYVVQSLNSPLTKSLFV